MEQIEKEIIKNLICIIEEELNRELSKEENIQILKNWDKFKLSLDR